MSRSSFSLLMAPFLAVWFVGGFAAPAFATETASAIRATLKVPSNLRAAMPIPRDVKAFLDRDFRSRYPVAAPAKIDVVDAWVEFYRVNSVPDGYGGYDTRHYFRVVARHATGGFASIDIALYERSLVEANQDRILIESFQVVGWQP
jgi:hypothetical protein